MEKDGKTSYHKNPWMVDSIKDFWFLNCPECNFKSKEEISFQKHAIEEHPFCNVLFKDSNSIEIDPLKVDSTVKYDIDSMSELNAFRHKEHFEEMRTLEFELVEQVNLSVNIVNFKTERSDDFVILKTINDETAKDPMTTKCDASQENMGNLKNQIIIPSNRKRNQNKATIYNEAILPKRRKEGSKSRSGMYCCAVYCHSRKGRETCGFFRVIRKRNHAQTDAWIRAIKRANADGSLWQPTEHTRICGLHFITTPGRPPGFGGIPSNKEGDPNYIPSRFETRQVCEKNETDQNRYQRKEERGQKRKHTTGMGFTYNSG
jgi:hypothetical protein